MSFHRRRELSGVEIRSLKHCTRAFHAYCTDFEFFAPSTWQGELWHRRRQALIGPGTVLCAHPGEVFLARRVIKPGAGHFLTIDARVFHEYLSGHPQPASKLQLSAFTKMSKPLEAKLREVFRVVRPGPSVLELQSAMAEFVAAMVGELFEESTGETASIDSGLRTAERVRECLHYDSSATIDLSTLAKQAGVSRYQALRLFKRRYGLPPHTYQLSVRLAMAQKALREGQQPVRVAAHYGFVDQSHFTRHFKRLLGVTPAQYARVGARALIKRPTAPYLGNTANDERSSRITDYGIPA
ncbi:MAG TPA: helix-turn-helix transcriptional regulator [Polyangiaceae bacterium]